MSSNPGFLIFACAAACVSTAAAQDTAPRFTARELFYHAVEAPSSETAKATPKPPVTKKKPSPPTMQASAQANPPRPLPDGGRVVQASMTATTAPAPPSGPALGLSYTILRRAQGKPDEEVATDTVFHKGDHILVKLVSNLSGYLYIITQGSSGTWKVRFPSAEVENGDTHVTAMHPYFFPGADLVFTFDDQPGTEKLFIIVSREPVPDIQDRIYGLQGGGKPEVAPKSKPVLVQANLNIPDSTIGRLRSLYSRDLIIEKVTPDTAGEQVDKKEFAVYVVNTTGSSSSSLVADIPLVHQ